MVSALVDVVLADLSHLAGELHQQVDDHSLRRGSAILRRLLVDNDLQKAWKAAGRPRQPLILATTLEPILAAVPQGKIALAAAGGALYQGMALMGMLEVGYVMPVAEMESIRAKGILRQQLPLDRYVGSTTMIVHGTSVSRRVLIKYVANKLGGAHFDPRRQSDAESKAFRLLDYVGETYQLAGKNAVYFELLAIGQALVMSTSIRAWLGLPPAEGPFAAA